MPSNEPFCRLRFAVFRVWRNRNRELISVGIIRCERLSVSFEISGDRTIGWAGRLEQRHVRADRLRDWRVNAAESRNCESLSRSENHLLTHDQCAGSAFLVITFEMKTKIPILFGEKWPIMIWIRSISRIVCRAQSRARMWFESKHLKLITHSRTAFNTVQHTENGRVAAD